MKELEWQVVSVLESVTEEEGQGDTVRVPLTVTDMDTEGVTLRVRVLVTVPEGE